MTDQLILFVEMSAERFGRLIDRMLDLHGNATTSLRFLDFLMPTMNIRGHLMSLRVSYLKGFVVYLKRSAVEKSR